MRMPVTISDGQVSGVDSLSSAASSVINWDMDEAGINRPRAALTTYTVAGLTTAKIIGMERWSTHTVLLDENRKFQRIADYGPGAALDLSSSSSATKLEGMATRPTWVTGKQYIYAAGGGRIQRWSPALALTEVLSSSPNCTHICSVGQYLIANDVSNPDRYLWSELGEGAWTTWPGNYSTFSARPENIVGIFENAGRVYVFGEHAVQVHEVGADPTLPFDLIGGVEVGLGAPYAFAKLDQQVAFLDHRRRVCVGDPANAEPISSAIDRDIRGLSTVSDCFLYREDVGQQSSLVVRFPTEARTFAFDLKGQRWKERKGYTAPFLTDYPVNGYAYRPIDNTHMVTSTATTGALYKLSTESRQDLAGPLVCERTTGWHDHGTSNRKRSNGLLVTMRRGTGAIETATAIPGALEVRVQADDGPWSPWQFISVGAPSDYGQAKKVHLHGIFRRRRYGLRYTTSEDTSLVSVQDDVTDLGGM